MCNTEIKNSEYIVSKCVNDLQYCFVAHKMLQNAGIETKKITKIEELDKLKPAKVACQVCSSNQKSIEQNLTSIGARYAIVKHKEEKDLKRKTILQELCECTVDKQRYYLKDLYKNIITLGNESDEEIAITIEDCRMSAKSSVVTTYNDVYAAEKNKYDFIQCWLESIEIVGNYKELVGKYNIEGAFIFNGRTHNLYPLTQYLRRQKIKFFCYEASEEWGTKTKSFTYVENEIVQNLDKRSELFKSYFEEMYVNTKIEIYKWSEVWLKNRTQKLIQTGNYPLFSHKFKNDNNNHNTENYDILILPTSEFEYAAYDHLSHGPMGSQKDFYIKLLKNFNKRVAIRLHPNSEGKDKTYIDDLLTKLKHINPEIKIFYPESQQNTYQLINNSRLIVSGFSLALAEAIFMGKPIIASTPALYSNFLSKRCLTMNEKIEESINKKNFDYLCRKPQESEIKETLKYCYMLNHHIKIIHAEKILDKQSYQEEIKRGMHWYVEQ